MITLQTELRAIRGLGENFLSKLEKLNIRKVRDLLWHFPYRYDDFSRVVPIAELQANQSATVSGIIKKVEARRTWRRKMALVEAIIVDDTGGIKAIWFNQPYIARILRVGMRANFSGKVAYSDGELYLSSPSYEYLGGTGDIKHTAGLIPVYSETKGLTSRGIRYLVKPLLRVLPPISDFIPQDILSGNGLPEINAALKAVHFPQSPSDADRAKKRFAFEDIFLLQLNNLKLRSRLAEEKAPALTFSDEERKALLETLPFELTGAQKKSLDECLADIKKPHPMNRLLQGDVGSGKTVIAAVTALIAARGGYQAAFMAPTEVLARQHYQTISKLFARELERSKIKVGLLVSGLSGAESRKTIKAVGAGEMLIIIGTHALIQKQVVFENLGVVIVDEQHRFGVEQRAALLRDPKKSARERPAPHFLSMSATPIPRTLSLTLFGDLDISIIDELPRGRKAIITKIVAPENRDKAYAFVRSEIRKGRQAFVICPRIAASENGAGDDSRAAQSEDKRKNLWLEVKNVTEEHAKLSSKIFPDLKVAMLHGKMKSAEKERVMNSFKAREFDMLVSTSVVEVGVDVPNATIMIIEGAERFGLAQLYQFRGRIGRGEHQSFCLLFNESGGDAAKNRLGALLKAKNGFDLAELDLQMRGPGEFLGDKQTGMPDLAMNALSNIELIKASRLAASEILKKDRELQGHPLLKERLSDFQKTVHFE